MFVKRCLKISPVLYWIPISLLMASSIIVVSCNQTIKQNKQEETENKTALAAIKESKKKLTDGALITRSDDDFESLALQNFSTREKVYSHSGILFKEDSLFVVYHCMAGIENPGGIMRRDPFDSFVNPTKKTGFGIFKYLLSDKEINNFHELIRADYKLKKPFDISFNLSTDDSIYCSEMIYKNLKAASGGKIELPVSVIHNFKPKIIGYRFGKSFYTTFKYIGIDDLYLNPFCREIKRIKY